MRVLVCGSNYGANYLGALRYQGQHEIVGLLARGSERSHQVAASFDVPLLTSPDQAERVDAACVAVGGAAGNDLSMALLRRGVAVLREHPVSSESLEGLFEAATAGGTTVHVVGHYVDFAPSSVFVEKARMLRSASTPLLVQVCTDAQFLWATLDILGSAMASTDFVLDEPAVRSLPADERLRLGTCSGSIAGVPIVLTYGLNYGSQDNGSMGFFGDEISLDFYRGRLCLVGIDGIVVMHRNAWALHTGVPVRPDLAPLYVGNGAAVEVVESPPLTSLQALERRYRANASAVDRVLAHAAGGGAPITQTPQYLRGLARAWRYLTSGKFVQFDATPMIVGDAAPSGDAAIRGDVP